MLYDPKTLTDTENLPNPMEVHVPFLRSQIGLGSTIKRITSAFGIEPCGGCDERARELDRRMSFVPWDE